jgi:hypothetical protein
MERPGTGSVYARKDWWWIFDPRFSLRARAALIVGAGALVFTFALSAITGLIYRRALEITLGATFETLAFQMSDKLDRAIYERYRSLQLAADLDPFRQGETRPGDRRRILESVQAASPDFAWIGFADLSGRITAATGRIFEGSSHATRPWFLAGRESPYVGSLRDIPELGVELPPSDAGEPSFRFLDVAVPVLGADGKLVGVLAGHVRWNWARAAQLSVVPEATGARERIGVTVYSASGDVLLDSGASGWSRPPDAPSVGEGRRFRGAIFENTAGGSSYLTGYMRSRGFREYRGIGWLTVVRQPVDRAFASVASLRRSIVLWGSLLALSAGVAAWIMAGRHARRLHVVGAAADRIREGDILTVLPRPKGETEMAHMCRALSDLVEDLRANQEALQAERARMAAQIREREAAKH